MTKAGVLQQIHPPSPISHPGFPPDPTQLWLDLVALQKQSELLNKSLLSTTRPMPPLTESVQSSRSTLEHAVWARRREKGCCTDLEQTAQCHVAHDLRNGAFSAAGSVVGLSFLCVVLRPSLHSAFIFSAFFSNRFHLWCSHTNIFNFCIKWANIKNTKYLTAKKREKNMTVQLLRTAGVFIYIQRSFFN